MKLTVDIGNTRSKYVLWKNGEIHKQDVFTGALQDNVGDVSLIESVAWCSTSDEAMDTGLFSNVHELKSFPREITTHYTTPETLGRDRIAGVLGALRILPGENVLVIDAGTCITTDLITSDRVYHGGSISPGLAMRFQALNSYTAKLPLVTPADFYDFLGKNTNESIQSGVIQGIAGELNHRIHHLLKKYTDLKVVFTGGDAAFLADYVNYRIFAEPLLVHYGLLYFLEINAI